LTDGPNRQQEKERKVPWLGFASFHAHVCDAADLDVAFDWPQHTQATQGSRSDDRRRSACNDVVQAIVRSCCGEADAFEADNFHQRDKHGEYLAITSFNRVAYAESPYARGYTAEWADLHPYADREAVREKDQKLPIRERPDWGLALLMRPTRPPPARRSY
jgi:hypothetical protein